MPAVTIALRDHERPHHIVFFVFQDVAMPDITSREAFKSHNYACHHLRLRPHSVLPAGFIRIGKGHRARISKLAGSLKIERIEPVPVQNLKSVVPRTSKGRVLYLRWG